MAFPLAQSDPQAVASAALFYVFAALTAGSAIAVVASRNVVRTAVALLFTLVGVAALFFLLRAEFLAAVQLVVYAGGTLILIIFGVMLTSKSPFSRFQPKPAEIVVAVVVGSVMLVALLVGIRQGAAGSASVALKELPAVTLPAFVQHDAEKGTLSVRGRLSPEQRDALLAAVPADAPANQREAYTQAVGTLYSRSQRLFAARPLEYSENYPVVSLGQVLLGDFLIPFEVVSELLLVVMIGAAFLAKARRRQAEGRPA
jgi:NADH-quinone oxidoreductase subunit J